MASSSVRQRASREEQVWGRWSQGGQFWPRQMWSVLAVSWPFPELQGWKGKTKGHFKKWLTNILETEWNKKPSQRVQEQPCYWHNMSLAAVVREAVNWASNTKLLCLALQQSRYRQGPCEHASHPPSMQDLLLPACATTVSPTEQASSYQAVSVLPQAEPGLQLTTKCTWSH